MFHNGKQIPCKSDLEFTEKLFTPGENLLCKSRHLFLVSSCNKLTINVPVVHMARDVMILMREIHFEGHFLEGVGPEYRDYFGS